MNENLHILIKYKGDLSNPEFASKVQSFNHLLYAVDRDWPFVVKRHTKTFAWWCQQCKGMEYQTPRLTARDIKAAARQLNLPVSIKVWKPAIKCQRQAEAADNRTPDNYITRRHCDMLTHSAGHQKEGTLWFNSSTPKALISAPGV